MPILAQCGLGVIEAGTLTFTGTGFPHFCQVRLLSGGAPSLLGARLAVLSDLIQLGDVQLRGLGKVLVIHEARAFLAVLTQDVGLAEEPEVWRQPVGGRAVFAVVVHVLALVAQILVEARYGQYPVLM